MLIRRLAGGIFFAVCAIWAVPAAPQAMSSCADAIEKPILIKLDPDTSEYYIFLEPNIPNLKTQYPEQYSNDSWRVTCKNDAMSDQPLCRVGAFDHSYLILYLSNSPQVDSVCVGGHDFPGRVAQIRIGDSAPISTDTKGCVRNKSSISDIASAPPETRVRLRSVHWPYDRANDVEFTVTKTMLDAIAFAKCLYLEKRRPLNR